MAMFAESEQEGDVDQWALIKIGEPFPEDPVRVKGQINQYVALWYKHGAPVCGRAWSNGGVVECSIPYAGTELTGSLHLGGDIQILTNPGAVNPKDSFKKRGFWYDWVPYSRRRERGLSIVHCATSAPILIENDKGEVLLGNVDLSRDIATVSHDGKASVKEGELKNNLILCRNFGPPPATDGKDGYSPTAQGTTAVKEERWINKRAGDTFPSHCVSALDRPLNNGPDEPKKQSVALWFKDGRPVSGRCWPNEQNKIEAAFGHQGKEWKKDVGSIQILGYTSADSYGHEYSWIPYSQALAKPNGWTIVKVKNVAPCVVKSADGKECLGQINLETEVASAGRGGAEETYFKPEVREFPVLCRRGESDTHVEALEEKREKTTKSSAMKGKGRTETTDTTEKFRKTITTETRVETVKKEKPKMEPNQEPKRETPKVKPKLESKRDAVWEKVEVKRSVSGGVSAEEMEKLGTVGPKEELDLRFFLVHILFYYFVGVFRH